MSEEVGTILKTGSVIGEYRVLALLGKGGMGEVYMVENIQMHKRYALKVLPPDLSANGSFIDRFKIEARVMADLSHPNIVHVNFIGANDGLYYLVMDYVESDEGKPKTLEDEIREKGSFSDKDVRELSLQICDALNYAHNFQEGVVHRDLKPSNILMDSRNNVKIADFGLAKVVGSDYLRNMIDQSIRLTMGGAQSADLSIGGMATMKGSGQSSRTTTGSLLGTYEYMAPEQQEGGEATARSDIYALGLIIYRMLTGKKAKGRFKLPSELGHNKQWDSIILKCLEPEAADRYDSVAALTNDIKAVKAPGVSNVGRKKAESMNKTGNGSGKKSLLIWGGLCLAGVVAVFAGIFIAMLTSKSDTVNTGSLKKPPVAEEQNYVQQEKIVIPQKKEIQKKPEAAKQKRVQKKEPAPPKKITLTDMLPVNCNVVASIDVRKLLSIKEIFSKYQEFLQVNPKFKNKLNEYGINPENIESVSVGVVLPGIINPEKPSIPFIVNAQFNRPFDLKRAVSDMGDVAETREKYNSRDIYLFYDDNNVKLYIAQLPDNILSFGTKELLIKSLYQRTADGSSELKKLAGGKPEFVSVAAKIPEPLAEKNKIPLTKHVLLSVKNNQNGYILRLNAVCASSDSLRMLSSHLNQVNAVLNQICRLPGGTETVKFINQGMEVSASVEISAEMRQAIESALAHARLKAKKISDANNLKQIGLALCMYAMDYKNKFPAPDGAAGFELLRKEEYLTEPKIFICPATDTKPAKPGEKLTEATVDYVYRGGAVYGKGGDTPVAWDKHGNFKDFGNVLYADGHVSGFSGKDWMEKAGVSKLIDKKNADAWYETGKKHYDKKEYSKALEYYRKAADKGNPDAMAGIGHMYYNGRGVKEDNPEALKWYKKAAANGNIKAMIYIGNMYLNGYGVKEDGHEAVKWYKKAADKGNTKAMNYIALIYYNGREGVKKDDLEAIKWYKKAADNGDTKAMVYVGNMYYWGYGVKKDYVEALKWYRKSADKEDPNGIRSVGNMYYWGNGVEKDYEKAMELYKKAAGMGNTDAMNYIADMYKNGWGVTKDLTEAKRWYQKAYDNGDKNAKEKLDKLK